MPTLLLITAKYWVSQEDYKMRKIFIITSMFMLLVWAGGAPFVGAAEPNKVDYTSYPVFMANTLS